MDKEQINQEELTAGERNFLLRQQITIIKDIAIYNHLHPKKDDLHIKWAHQLHKAADILLKEGIDRLYNMEKATDNKPLRDTIWKLNKRLSELEGKIENL